MGRGVCRCHPGCCSGGWLLDRIERTRFHSGRVPFGDPHAASGCAGDIPPSETDGPLVPTAGVATLQGGYIRTLDFYPRHPPGRVATSVNNSSPVTAPPTATPMNLTCSH